MITISKEANKNYLAKIVRLKGLKKHPNGDRLQVVSIDFQNVITGLEAKENDIYVFFPLECKINKDFLSFTNSFRDKSLNQDKEKAGFFEENGRVRATKLRGEKSMGYLVPIEQMEFFLGYNIYKLPIEDYIGQEFDTINNIKVLEKYVVKTRESRSAKEGKKPKVSRLVENQVRLHVDTENLRKNVHKINPEDTISITYKTHGTSGVYGNVLVKKKLNLVEKLLSKIGIKVQDVEYDLIFSSRKVIKNEYLKDPKNNAGFYNEDVWGYAAEKYDLKNKIPKGYTLYVEILGYTPTGKMVQKNYDYGCSENEMKLEVYRITHTTPDGLVTELSYPQIKEFCERVNLTPAHLFYYGEAKDIKFSKVGLLDYSETDSWREYFIKCLEEDYNEKNCFVCKNTVPEEGIVVKKESLFSCESYKLKSFRFLQYESAELDKGESDIESEN